MKRNNNVHPMSMALFELLLAVMATIDLVTAVAPMATAVRESQNFDFGWRFHLGDPAGHGHGKICPADAFPKNLSGVQCMNLHFHEAKTADDCRNACCFMYSCGVWQFESTTVSGGGCWLGNSNDCNNPFKAWVGGGRTPPSPPTPGPPATKGPTSRGYDDSSWQLVDAPHDPIIAGTYSPDADRSHAYLPLNTTWYRKHFNLVAEWRGQAIFVYFEGVFRSSIVYLNGLQLRAHDSGYTSFIVRLDNASTVLYGDGKENENVLVVRATASGGSGWWYEGGGIYRHNHLIVTSMTHAVVDSIYGPSNVTGEVFHEKRPLAGSFAESADFFPQVDVVNDGSVAESGVQVKFTLYDQTGNAVGQAAGSATSSNLSPGQIARFTGKITVSNVLLWTSARPHLYQMSTIITDSKGRVLDEVHNVSLGVRTPKWTADSGFYLNGKPFIWRGFCDHNDFAGVGVAVPDRINLFRAQALRAVGGNSWRMSHNPPVPVLLDILDRLGVLVWDENRNFGNRSNWVQCMRDMVRRDRNHPSVIIWSFCNEGGCMEGSGPAPGEVGEMFKEVSYEEDPWRPVAANMNSGIGNTLSGVIDVQGFSHQNGQTYDNFHKAYPNKPTVGSECCSCVTQRGEDVANGSKPNLGNFNGPCLSSQNGWEFMRKYVAGTMVWTLFDYFGEPAGNWPMVSSSFGSIDLAGFSKAAAFWYRSWWLMNSTQSRQSLSSHDVPHHPPALLRSEIPTVEHSLESTHICHIVQHWEAAVGGSSRTIQVYTDLPKVELFLNSKSVGTSQVEWFGWAEFHNVAYANGNLTAAAMDSDGTVLATHSRLPTSSATQLRLDVDVPSPLSGTGTALVLDGQDTGMVRASVLDSEGQLLNSASNNITFQIVSGPGRVLGVGNGDPTCHEHNQYSWRSAYHGLARAIIQVTHDSASPERERLRLLQVDADGNKRTRIVAPGEESTVADSIVVEASSPGLKSAQATIQLSTNAVVDGVLAVAEKWMHGQK